MSNIIERQSKPTPVVPSGVFSVELTSHEIYLEPQDVVVGHKPGTKPRYNDEGERRYRDPDGSGNGFFSEGSEPEGWEPWDDPDQIPVTEPRRGALGGVLIHEKDAEGNKIARGTAGYSPVKEFGLGELKSILADNPELVDLYEAKVAADAAFATAFAALAVPPASQ